MSLSQYDAPDGTHTTRIPAGTAVFRRAVADHFGFARTEVVRDKARCEKARSEHCEARGIDFFATDLVLGRRVFDWAVTHADRLGVQSVIFNRRVAGFGNPTERHYTGPSPHTDHVHIGLTRSAAVFLTRGEVDATLKGDDMSAEDVAAIKGAIDYAIKASNDRFHAVDLALADLRSSVDRLTAGGGGVDMDVLARKVADELADRLRG